MDFWDAHEAPSAVELLEALDLVEREAIEATIAAPGSAAQEALRDSKTGSPGPSPERRARHLASGSMPAGGALTTTAAKQITHMRIELDRALDEVDRLKGELQASQQAEKALQETLQAERRGLLIDREAPCELPNFDPTHLSPNSDPNGRIAR